MPNDVKKLMAQARKRNAEMDATDRDSGFAPPGGPAVSRLTGEAIPEAIVTLMLLRTAMQAINCGMSVGDWGTVAEGQGLLERLHSRIDPEGREFRPSDR